MLSVWRVQDRTFSYSELDSNIVVEHATEVKNVISLGVHLG